MYLRKYHPSDCAALAALFYETIHTVNARDYPQEQLDAWADGHVDLDAWNESFLAHNTYVAVQECVDADDIDSRASDSAGSISGKTYCKPNQNMDNVSSQLFDSSDTAPGKTGGNPANALIIGFGDMDDTGYLDRLYVHKDYQGRGVATAICDRLEEDFCLSRGRLLQNSAMQKRKNDTFTTHASITARPFFEKRGYTVVKAQQVVRKGISIRNYIMRKRIEYSV